MKKKLTVKEIFITSFMIFGVFFGAGNLLFPPFLGKEAGSDFLISIIGFSISAVVFCMIGVYVTIKADGLDNILSNVDPFFAILYPTFIYLSIGPFLAVPRAGSIIFDIAILPNLSNNISIYRLIYTIVFFIFVFWFCINPTKLVNKIGKFLTPTLIILITVMFIKFYLKYRNIELAEPSLEYLQSPFFKGFVEGYNTMDTLGGLLYGLLLYISLKSLGLNDKKIIEKYSRYTLIYAGILLSTIYAMIAYVGAIVSKINPNINERVEILRFVVYDLFGEYGLVFLSLIFLLACFSVSVGLLTTISKYFAEKQKIFSYKKILLASTLVSAYIANYGLEKILKISVPILLLLYPVTIVLITLQLFNKFINKDRLVYMTTVYTSLFFSILQFFNYKLNIKLPLDEINMSWLIPTSIVFIITIIYVKIRKTAK